MMETSLDIMALVGPPSFTRSQMFNDVILDTEIG